MFKKRKKLPYSMLFLLLVVALFGHIYRDPPHREFTDTEAQCDIYLNVDSNHYSNRSKIFFSKLMFHFSKTYENTPIELDYRLAGACTHTKAFLREEALYNEARQKERLNANIQ